MRVRELTTGRPMRLIFSVALPLMLGNIFQQLYTVVDTLVIGRFNGVSVLAGLGASDWFNWLFLSIVQGMTQGCGIPVAQHFGAKRYGELKKTAANAIWLSAAVALIVMGVAQAVCRPMLGLLGTPEEILPVSLRYLRIIFAGLPIVTAYNLMSDILRALGDSKTPLYAMIAASLINIALDLLFVGRLGMGVAGAAVATLIAQALSCVFCFIRLRGVELLRLKKEDLRPSGRVMGKMLRLGIPVSAQNAIIALGGMIVQTIVNRYGVTFIAGYTATNKLYGVLEIAAISYGYALSAYTGQNLGANRQDRIREGIRAGMTAGVLTALGITVLMLLFGRSVLSLFLSGTPEETEAALGYAWQFLQIMAGGLFVLYILHTVRSSLQGMGNTLMPMVSGIAEFVMRTGSVLLLPGLIGYAGVFWAEVLAWLGADCILVTALLLSPPFREERKKRKAI